MPVIVGDAVIGTPAKMFWRFKKDVLVVVHENEHVKHHRRQKVNSQKTSFVFLDVKKIKS